jgi:hypothetical protein
MKAGLKINKHFIIVKHNIGSISMLTKELHLEMNSGQYFILSRQGDLYLDSDEYGVGAIHIELEPEEYLRIQQELSEYLDYEVCDQDEAEISSPE